MTERSGTETRLVELLAVLSLATDLGVGRPLENELRVTVVGMVAAVEDIRGLCLQPV